MYRYIFDAEAELFDNNEETVLHTCKDLEVKYTSKRLMNISDDIDAEIASAHLKNAYLELLERDGFKYDENTQITLTSYGITQVDEKDTYVFKYLFHGSIGITSQNGGEEIRAYEDIEVPYESRRPLNINDGPDLALAYMFIKDAYVKKLLDENLTALVNKDTHIDVLTCGLTEIEEPKPLVVEVTDRGFKQIQFVDTRETHCSLQESSNGSGPNIWLGINKPEIKYLVPGFGWKDWHLPEHFMISGRMELNQQQVRDLLPHLHRFVQTGEL